jgi:thiol-disulfide isomerase/thioredoxin
MDSEQATHASDYKPPPSKPHRSGLAAWIGLGLAAILFVTFLRWRPRPTDGVEHPVVGQRLLLLDVEPLTGEGKRSTLADLAGKVTLVNFWGTWCPPCGEEFPYLASIDRKFKERSDFRYLSVSYGDPPIDDVRDATNEFLRRMRADHPTYYDPQDKTLFGLLALGVENAFPTTVVLDRDGTIRGVWLGYNRAAIGEIESLLERLLK